MQSDWFWQMFRETGEPVCWLIYRRLRQESPPKPDTPPGESPGE